MKLEKADGTFIDNVTAEELSSALEEIARSSAHLILSDGEDYIQSAAGPGGYMIEYHDGTGHFRSSSERLSGDTAAAVFLAYLKKDPEWKGKTDWLVEEGGHTTGPEQVTAARGGGRGFSPEGLLDSVKRQAGHEVKRAVNRRTSGAVRKILRRFLG